MQRSKQIITLQLKVLYMESQNYQNDLSHIRSMMEKSSRNLSLSGLAGVVAGVAALLGAGVGYFILRSNGKAYADLSSVNLDRSMLTELSLVALLVFAMAVSSAYFLSVRRSRRQGLKIWDGTARRLLMSFSVPVVSGAVFCLGLLLQQHYLLVLPASLIFYGLALISASRYTFTDVQYLGFCEIVLGLISTLFPATGLLCWAIGFGLLHIVYGIIMYRKYQ